MKFAVNPMPWIVALLVVTILQCPSGFTGVMHDLILPGNDDYVRLAQVRDWMAGASWFDVTQERLGPDGIVMHWSRLVDLPLAALVRFFALFTDLDMAEKLMAITWPLMLLVVFTAITITAARRMNSAVSPLVVVLFVAVHSMTTMQFEPGRIDHHNIQIVAMALVLLGALDHRFMRGGITAGLACALSVVVGMEALGPITLFGLLFAADWVIGTDRRGERLGAFGLAFAAAICAGFLVGVAPAQYLVMACDALSLSYGLPIVVAGTGAFALASLSSRLGVRGRAAACAGLLTASVGVLLAIDPACIAGPYALVPEEVTTRWMSQIAEAQGLMVFFETYPASSSAYMFFTLVGVAAGFLLQGSAGSRARWTTVIVVLPAVALFALSFVQVRQGQFVGIWAIPATAAAYPIFRRWVVDTASAPLTSRSKGAMALVAGCCALLALSFAVQGSKPTRAAAVAPQSVPASTSAPVHGDCMARARYHEFARLPKGRVLNPNVIAGRLLTTTGHHVLVGPYHRSAEAVLDGMDLIGDDLERIRTIIEERQAHYVALCFDGNGPASRLTSHAVAGTTPSWLEEVHVSGGLYVYRTGIPLADTAM